jgi:hypothetical protein
MQPAVNIWEDFLSEWGAWIPEVFSTELQVDLVSSQVPSAWIEAVKHPDVREAVTALWRPAEQSLPAFVQYLVHETDGLAIGRGDIGCVLIYSVRAFREISLRRYLPGFVFAGTPAPQHLIDAFVASHGPLPDSLIALWRMHSFCRTKEGFVSSLSSEPQPLVGAPRLLAGARRDTPETEERYDCLAVIDAARPSQLSLIRTAGTRPWEDVLVGTFDSNDTLVPSPWRSIDGTLTHFRMSRYVPGA